jgi:coenzyme F420-reducing hydrogenase gamma subunit
MEVTTASEALQQHRRAIVEMLFAGGDHVCAFCPASGRCELQELARLLGLDHVTLGVARRAAQVDASHPRFAIDPGRCVLCARCVRTCSEVERANTLGVAGRGRSARVVIDAGAPWGESSTCTSCGRCVAACPTGAMYEKDLAVKGATLRRHASSTRARLATVQLGGCAGCHASLLDSDERLLPVAERAELVYSPLLADAKRFPDHVDVCLVEGAASTEADVQLLRAVRERTRHVVALGDCAAWGNITAMRDAIGGAARVLSPAWSSARRDPLLPALLDRVLPVQEIVAVDVFLPGCPPAASLVFFATSELLEGRIPRLAGSIAFG